jgi:ELWxxDGT repeat protein
MSTRGGRQARAKVQQRRRSLKAARRRARHAVARPIASTATATTLVVAGMVTASSPAAAGGETALVADLAPGALASRPDNLTAVGDTVFFTLEAKDESHWGELWRSDGTASGTVLVKDLTPGAETTYFSPSPRDLTVVGDTLFFTAGDGEHGRELWRSDGTAAGTVLVKDINPEQEYAYAPVPQHLTAVGNTLFFSADDGVHGPELWRSDGSTAGTVQVKDVRPGTSPDHRGPHALAVHDGTLYFVEDDDTHGNELWRSDGTAPGTVLVTEIVPGANHGYYSGPAELTSVAGALYFAVDDGTHGHELWRTDGTAAGTAMVEDIAPGSTGSRPYALTDVAGELFFTASDGTHGTELWHSDGSAAGTAMVKEIYPGPEDEVLVDQPYGSPDFERSVRPTMLTAVGDRVFFTADDAVHHRELWVSDGTAAGTAMVEEIDPSTTFEEFEDNGPADLTAFGGDLYFTVFDGPHGRELWSSDGSADGTAMIADINPSASTSYLDDPDDLTPAGALLFFSADDGAHGRELWRTGGEVAPDTTPPDTAITSGPAPGSRTGATSVTFGFQGTAGDTAKLQCALDGGAFFDCVSPRTFANLTRTTHKVRFRAVDFAGNIDPTPAERTFVVTVPSNVFAPPRAGTPLYRTGARPLSVTLPERGLLRIAPVRRAPVRATTYSLGKGTSTVVLKPTKAGLKQLRKRLRKAKRAGRHVASLAVTVKLTFTPAGGTPRSRTLTYTLKLR